MLTGPVKFPLKLHDEYTVKEMRKFDGKRDE